MSKARVGLGFAVSLVFLYIAFRGQNLGRIWQALGEADYWWLIPGFAAYFAGLGMRTVRWSILLQSIRKFRERELFPVVLIGLMANNVLPFRAGEVVRAYVLSVRSNVSKSGVLATIAVEKISDGLTMLVFMLIASLSVALTDDLRRVGYVATLIFGIILIALVLVSTARSRGWIMSRLVSRLPARFEVRIGAVIHSFLDGLAVLRRRNELAMVTAASLAAWLLEAMMFLFVSEAFQLHLHPAAILLTTAVANLATLIPSSPGYVGTFESGVLLVLVGAIGIPQVTALSYAITLHAALYFPVTFVGLYCWWRESLSWRTIRRLAAEEA